MNTTDPIDAITPRSIVLISGAPLTGKYWLMLRLLAETVDRAVVITTKHPARRVRADFRELVGDVPDEQIGVIDTVTRFVADAPGSEETAASYVASPENLTRIGVEFTRVFDRVASVAPEEPVGVGLHSATQLIMHSDVKKVNHFVQVLTSQLRSSGAFGAVVVDAPVVDPAELQTLETHFDGVIETRMGDPGAREFRGRGFERPTSEWAGF